MPSQDFLDDLWGSPEPEVPIKSSTFNAVKMAKYFQDSLLAAKWYHGFGIVNHRALAGQFVQWRKAGVVADTIYEMIDAYMRDYKLRGEAPSWQDFLYRREKIATSLASTGEKTQLDTYDALEADYDEERAMKEYLERKNR